MKLKKNPRKHDIHRETYMISPVIFIKFSKIACSDLIKLRSFMRLYLICLTMTYQLRKCGKADSNYIVMSLYEYRILLFFAEKFKHTRFYWKRWKIEFNLSHLLKHNVFPKAFLKIKFMFKTQPTNIFFESIKFCFILI